MARGSAHRGELTKTSLIYLWK